jgi:hypothetical protein
MPEQTEELRINPLSVASATDLLQELFSRTSAAIVLTLDPQTGNLSYTFHGSRFTCLGMISVATDLIHCDLEPTHDAD